MKNSFFLFLFLTSSIVYSQDILLLKKNGGAIEGYLQKATKKGVFVKLGFYITSISRKDVDIIYGEPYTELKSKGKINYLHEIDHSSVEIKKAVKASRSELSKHIRRT